MRPQTKKALFGSALILFVSIITNVRTAQSQGVPPPCVPNPATENAVLEWNCRTFKYALSPTFGGALRQIRAMAVVQLAVHNAVNGITGKFETYRRDDTNTPPENASSDAAAIGAAYQALYGMVTPAQRTQLDTELAASLLARGIAADDPSLLYGKAEGQNMVTLRTGDGSGPEAQCAYVDIVDPAPGVWRRVVNVDTGVPPPAATPCWTEVPTFVLNSRDQFPLDDPPDLNSERFLVDLQEVKNLGGQNPGTHRQEWQSRIADFWDGSPVGIANQVVRQAATAQTGDPSTDARGIALVYLAGVDASIACWHYKYTKLFWRPETAVNLTDPLPGLYWRPYLFPSHPHPEYPSGHSTNSGALLAGAALAFGDDPGVVMTPTITRNGISVSPTWETFSEGINEVIDARVYSGLHYRFTDEASAKLGGQIAKFVSTHALRECNKGNKCK